MADLFTTDSFTSSENNVEANGDGPAETLSNKPLVKAHALQSEVPMMAADGGSGLKNQGSTETLEMSGEGLPRPQGTTAATAAAGAAAGVAAAARPAGYADDDDDSSRDESSAASMENPSELRRSGSGSSISTLGSTSTTSSTWPSNDGFVTPARTDIARGGGRYGAGGAGRGGKAGGGGSSSSGTVTGSGGVDGLPPGFRTPANRGATVPETPSPRSVSSSVHGTPAVSKQAKCGVSKGVDT